MASPIRPFLSKVSLAFRESFILSLIGTSFRGYCRLVEGLERNIAKVFAKIPTSPRKQGEEAPPTPEETPRPMLDSGLLVGSTLGLLTKVADIGKDSFACNAPKEAFWGSRERVLMAAGLIILGAGASLLLLEIIDRKALSLSYLPLLILLTVAGLAFLRGGAKLEEGYRRSLLGRLRGKPRDEKRRPSSDCTSREGPLSGQGEKA